MIGVVETVGEERRGETSEEEDEFNNTPQGILSFLRSPTPSNQ
jgi:hypothetical protein